MSHILKFEYGPQLRTGLMVVGFFIPCTIVLAIMAKGNSAGLIINHVIEFSADYATIFLWLLMVFSALISFAGIYSLYLWQFLPRNYIEISCKDIKVPAMTLRPAQYIQLADVICCYETIVTGVHTYNIHGTEGKIAVSHPHFKNRAEYEEFLLVTARYLVENTEKSS